jgi:hypothetical protein
MLFTVVLVLFVITQTTKIISPDLLESNLVFYMMVFLLLMAQVNLTKNTFSMGWFRYSDETKIQFLFSLKAFVTVWVCLKYVGCKTLFDFDLEEAH